MQRSIQRYLHRSLFVKELCKVSWIFRHPNWYKKDQKIEVEKPKTEKEIIDGYIEIKKHKKKLCKKKIRVS